MNEKQNLPNYNPKAFLLLCKAIIVIVQNRMQEKQKEYETNRKNSHVECFAV